MTLEERVTLLEKETRSMSWQMMLLGVLGLLLALSNLTGCFSVPDVAPCLDYCQIHYDECAAYVNELGDECVLDGPYSRTCQDFFEQAQVCISRLVDCMETCAKELQGGPQPAPESYDYVNPEGGAADSGAR